MKDGHSSLLDVQPNLRISLISNGILESGKSRIDLTWQDVISPTRVSIFFNKCNSISYIKKYRLYLVFKLHYITFFQVARNMKDHNGTSQILGKGDYFQYCCLNIFMKFIK